MNNKIPNRCERCGDFLHPKSEVWLTLDKRTNTFTDGDVPEEFSQGGFPFGRNCAKNAIIDHVKAKTVSRRPRNL